MTSTEPGPPEVEALRKDAWERAFHASGTSYIFRVRAQRLKKKISSLTWVGITIPLLVGGIVGLGNAVSGFVPAVILAAGVLGLVQLAVNAWSIIRDWPGSYAQSIQSMNANEQLRESYEHLAKHPPGQGNATQLTHDLNVINAQETAQKALDSAQLIQENERRMGMRAALFNRGKECAECSLKPASMKPTRCGVCGDFPKRWIK